MTIFKFALIGDPISHSRSPELFAQLFDEHGTAGEYELLRIEKGGLCDVRKLVREKKLDGFNVTMPHKRDIIAHLDALTAIAEKVGSVNAVRVKNGVLTGDCTDGAGFAGALFERGIALPGKKLMVYGSGGAAAAICYAGICAGARVCIAARNKAAGEALAARLGCEYLGEMPEGECDVFANATPLGMTGFADFASFDFLDSMQSAAVFDAVYEPMATSLLRAADFRGMAAIGGARMLYYQAVAGYKFFTE